AESTSMGRCRCLRTKPRTAWATVAPRRTQCRWRSASLPTWATPARAPLRHATPFVDSRVKSAWRGSLERVRCDEERRVGGDGGQERLQPVAARGKRLCQLPDGERLGAAFGVTVGEAEDLSDEAGSSLRIALEGASQTARVRERGAVERARRVD